MSENVFLKTARDKLFLIMAHRGFWGGNVIENSIESSLLAYKAGADIVEIDVCRTTDNQYYLFHDGNEPKLLSRLENFHELSSEEVDASDVNNSIGSVSGYKINTLRDFLTWLPENKLVNIDRSWKYWADSAFFNIIEESGKEHQLVFKSPVEKEYLDNLAEHGTNLAYIPIIKKKEELEWVLSYPDIQTIGVELIATDLRSELLSEPWIQKLHEAGLLIVANAENLGKNFNLFGGLSDDTALFGEAEWDGFVQAGVDVIQTDWPNFLFDYREKTTKRG